MTFGPVNTRASGARTTRIGESIAHEVTEVTEVTEEEGRGSGRRAKLRLG
jgi:hypothetical protein